MRKFLSFLIWPSIDVDTVIINGEIIYSLDIFTYLNRSTLELQSRFASFFKVIKRSWKYSRKSSFGAANFVNGDHQPILGMGERHR